MLFRKSFALTYKLLWRILMTADELKGKIDGLTAQVTKIGTESAASVKMITDLKAQIAALGSDVPQSVVDAVNALGAQIQAVDDLVPDAPAPSPNP
jgi:hypothetical protein